MFADMHLHTNLSDGSDTVRQVLDRAHRNNVSMIAITDHNSLAAHQIIREMDPTDIPIRIFAGAEFDVIHDRRQYHLLGYGLDIDNRALLEMCEYNTTTQENYNQALLRELAKDVPEISEADYMEYEMPLGRGGWKLLNYLLDAGVTGSLLEGTKYYGQYGFDSNNIHFASLSEAVCTIKNASGIPILAHPAEQIPYHADGESRKAFYRAIESILQTGVRGIECIHPLHGFDLEGELISFCGDRGLYVSGGSDYHGSFFNKQKQKIGGQFVEVRTIHKMLEALAGHTVDR